MSSIARKLMSGSAIKLTSLVLHSLVALLLMPFIVKCLGDRLYGFWVVVGTLIGYYGFLDLGLSSAVIRHIAASIGAKKIEECNPIINTSLFIYFGLVLIVLSMTGMLAVLSTSVFEDQFDADLFKKIVLILGFHTALELPLNVFVGILTAKLKFNLIAIIRIMTLFFRTILIIIALNAGYKIVALAWITFLSSIPGKFFFIYFSKKCLPLMRISLKYWGQKTARIMMNYSLYTFLAQVAAILRFRLDFFVITAFIGFSTVTHYNVASIFITQFFAIMLALNSVLTPTFSQLDSANEHERLKNLLLLATKISICISSFIGFGMIFWGQPFIIRWMNSNYLDAYPCLVVLVLGSLCTLWQIPSVNLLFGTSKHKFFAWSNLAEGGINLMLSIIFIRHFGIFGVALGTCIPMIIIKLFIQPFYVCKVSSIRYQNYFLTLGKTIFVVSLSLILPSIISLNYILPYYRVLLMVGSVSLLLYSLCIWFFVFSTHEKNLILKASPFFKSANRSLA